MTSKPFTLPLETKQIALDNMVTSTRKLCDQTSLVVYSNENCSKIQNNVIVVMLFNTCLVVHEAVHCITHVSLFFVKVIINLCMAVKEYQEPGGLSTAMILVCVFQFVCVADVLLHEVRLSCVQIYRKFTKFLAALFHPLKDTCTFPTFKNQVKDKDKKFTSSSSEK